MLLLASSKVERKEGEMMMEEERCQGLLSDRLMVVWDR